MTQKIIHLEGVGEITVRRRKGAKNIKLSVASNGKVSISIPWWASFGHAERFVDRNSSWIEKQLTKVHRPYFENGARVGKNHVVQYTQSLNGSNQSTRVSNGLIRILSPLPIDSEEGQQLIIKSAEKALRIESQALLTSRLESLANEHGFNYKETKIKKLKSRWGSCSSDKTITLNYYLVQLPWNLIDYVLLHELTHTVQMNHGPKFWEKLESVYPNAKHWRKVLKEQKPDIIPS